MADIKLRIEVNPNAETETLGTITNEINDVGSNENLSNASFKASSKGVYLNTSNPKESGREMLSWGADGKLKFTSDGFLSNNGTTAGVLIDESNPDMFVWGVVPSTKKYSVKLTFSNATSLKDIIIYGDKTANQFPTKAIIDGTKTIYSDDPQWAINMETESDKHTIEFLEWNRAGYNACLTKIMVMLKYLDLDKSWIDSIESLSQSTSDPSSIQYGVLAETGSANIRDLDGEIADYIKDGIINNSDVPAVLYVNNNKMQSLITSDSDYDNQDKVFNAQFTDLLGKWDGLAYSGRTLTKQTTLYNLLYELLSSLKYTDTQIGNMISGYIKPYLQSITIPYPYLESGTYCDAINKICTMAQLSIMADKNGLPVFVSANPVATESETTATIKIPKNMMITPLNNSLILKNKYDGIDTIGKTTQLTKKYIYSSDLINFTIDESGYADVSSDNPDYHFGIMFTETIPSTYAGSNEGYILSVSYSFDLAKSPEVFMWDTSKIKIYYSFDKTDRLNVYKKGWFSSDLTYSDTQASISSYASNPTLSISDGKLNIKFTVFIQARFQGAIAGDKKWTELIPNNLQFYIETDCLDMKDFSITSNNPASIDSNELFQDGALYQNKKKMLDVMKDAIVTNYKDGVSTAVVNVFCGDMFDIYNHRVKNWQNGEMINTRDIVCFENDVDSNNKQRYWRVTGRKFFYNGSPQLSLELQEIKTIRKMSMFSEEIDVTMDGAYTFTYNLDDYLLADNKISVGIGRAGNIDAHSFSDVGDKDQTATVISAYGDIDITINDKRCSITTHNAVGSFLIMEFTYWQ